MSWDDRFMGLALEVRSWVKGPDLGVGACIVSPNRRQFALGYSGLPRNIEDSVDRLTSKLVKDAACVHAEINAIINAQCSVVGWTLYATKCPCSNCAAAILQAGISTVVAPLPDKTSSWCYLQETALELFKEGGVHYEAYNGG